jgi:hypothetical protein
MPLDRPTASELRRVLDHHASDRVRLSSATFDDRIAAHLEAILAREQEAVSRLLAEEQARLQAMLGIEGNAEMLHKTLCEQIRWGVINWRDPVLMIHLRDTVDAKLAIDNPRYKG